MKYLLTEQDFRGEINVPNTADSLVCAELSAFIQQYEPHFCDMVLGVAFAAEFYSAADQATVEAKWQLLIDGGTWTDDHTGTSYTRRIQPLKYCAARYVYWHWQRNRATLTSGTGEMVTVGKDITMMSPISKQVTTWNQMVRELPQLWQFLRYYSLAGVLQFPTFVVKDPQYSKFRPQNVFNL